MLEEEAVDDASGVPTIRFTIDSSALPSAMTQGEIKAEIDAMNTVADVVVAAPPAPPPSTSPSPPPSTSPSPPPPVEQPCPQFCCMAMTASCLACKECTTVDAVVRRQPEHRVAGLRERGRRVHRGAGDGGAGDDGVPPAAVVGGDELDAGDGTALTQSAAPVDGGAIAGAVVGVLALVVVAVGVGVVVVLRRRRQRQELASRTVGVDAIEAKVGAPATFVHGACARFVVVVGADVEGADAGAG